MKPYPEQLEGIKIAAKAGRGVVTAPTGLGKSIMMALLVNELQVKTLIVVPNLGLKRQLTASFKEYFGSLKNITIENIDSSALLNAKDYDCLIIDEAHHVAANTYRMLNRKVWNNIYYRFFFTATPFRSKTEETILFESLAGEIIYQIPYKTAVEKGYIVPLEVYYVDLPEVKMKGSAEKYAAVYSELVVNNEYLNRVVTHMVSNLHAAGISSLVLTKQVNHGLKIQELLAEEGIMAPFAKGENDDNETIIADFNSLAEPSLVGTEGVIGEGVDTKPCEYVFDVGGGKSKNRFMQKAGRGFRRYGDKESCKLILFRYGHNKWLKQHFSACVKHLKDEYGVVPTKLSISL